MVDRADQITNLHVEAEAALKAQDNASDDLMSYLQTIPAQYGTPIKAKLRAYDDHGLAALRAYLEIAVLSREIMTKHTQRTVEVRPRGNGSTDLGPGFKVVTQ